MLIFFEVVSRRNIEEALATDNGKIAYQDLGRYIYFVKEDQDINFFLTGLERFQSQLEKIDYRLSVPIMKLFYVLGRTDKALELFMDKVKFKI
jgi:hypothetical protein